MRLAADNSVVMKGIKVLINAKVRGRPFPFYRRDNEDLRETLWHALGKCRHQAVAADWAKAHATQAQTG